jgi:hypothetical protein
LFVFPQYYSFPTDELIFFRGVGQPPTRVDRRAKSLVIVATPAYLLQLHWASAEVSESEDLQQLCENLGGLHSSYAKRVEFVVTQS